MLFGVAEALREVLNRPLPLTQRAGYEHDVAAVRTELNDTTFAAGWAEGRAMPLEQAIAYVVVPETWTTT